MRRFGKGKFTTFLLTCACAMALPAQTVSQNITWTKLSSKTGGLPSPNGGSQQTASLILDVDKNGVADFIIGERSLAPSVLWYRRVGNNWEKYIIDNTTLRIEAGGAYYDIDGDGDLDIVFCGDSGSNQIWWWENPYPNYSPTTPWTRRLIKNSGSSYHHDAVFGDFDGDGKAEFVFWNQNARALMMARIPADPRATQPWEFFQIFSHSADPVVHEGLAAVDMDNDGVVDIVGAGRWWKHVSGNTFSMEIIDSDQKFTRTAVGQLKRGGRPEVVFCAGDATGPITYHEWNGTSWSRRELLTVPVINGHSLEIGDIDGDGNLDIFSAEMRLNGGNANAKMRVFFGDGRGNFTLQEIGTGIGNHESKIGDLDGDGDLDILIKPFNWDTPRVDVWLNNGTRISPPYPLSQWQRRVIDQSKPWRTIFITAADMDNDGKKDIITGGWWYKNPGNPTDSWIRNTVGSPLNNMALVYDFDNDGSMDVLGTKGIGENSNSEFVWGSNNGSGTFTILSNIQNGDGDFLQGVGITRLTKGSPLDVLLSWHIANKGIQALTVPANPSTTTWAWRRISTTSQDEEISIADITRNGNRDIVLGTKWLRNDGSAFTPFTLNPTSGDPDRNRLGDINRDGRIDVVIGFEAISVPGKLAWYEQPVNPTGTWIEHIISTSVIGPMSVDLADMDHDGDLDVIVGEHNTNNPSAARLIIFENTNGLGTAWNQIVVYTGDEHHDGAQVVDIDNDGDLDIISIGWNNPRVVWYENRAIVLPTSVEEKGRGELPGEFKLDQNYPNPFNPTTRISFSLAEASPVTLRIVNTLGQDVATLVSQDLPAGSYETTFDAVGLSSGIYFYSLTAGALMATRKMVIVK